MNTSQRKSEGIKRENRISKRTWKILESPAKHKCFKMMVKNQILGWAHYGLGFCREQERLEIHLHWRAKMNHRAAEYLSYFSTTNVSPQPICHSCCAVLVNTLSANRTNLSCQSLHSYRATINKKKKKAAIKVETSFHLGDTSQLKEVFHWTSNCQGRSAPCSLYNPHTI